MDTSSSDVRTARHFGVLIVVFLGLAGAPRLQAQTRAHLEGEYGLWVTERAQDLHVGWLTDEPARGLLEVLRNGRQLHRFETGLSQSHSADFRRPPDGTLVLRYGALGGILYATTVYLTQEETPPPAVLTGVDSLFVVGDVHGEYDNLSRLLENAGLIDSAGRWSGGRKHVAFVGDYFDRGPDATKVLWFLYRLEHEAARAGGGAHVILGNHEAMIFTNDLRYTAPKEKLIAQLHGTAYPRLFDIRRSVLGRWLSSRPGLMRIDGVLLAHGGVTPEYAHYGVEEFNDSVRSYMAGDFFYYMDGVLNRADTTAALVTDSVTAELIRVQHPTEHVVVMNTAVAQRQMDFFFSDSSVFWFRGYARDTTGAALGPDALPETERADPLASDLEEVLKRYGADVHVVGHTPGKTIHVRYGGWLIDVDLLNPASAMVLLVRDPRGGYRAYEYGLNGKADPLPGWPLAARFVHSPPASFDDCRPMRRREGQTTR
jgi:hypothetical protein